MTIRTNKCKKHGGRKRRTQNKSRRRGLRYWAAIGALSALIAYAPLPNREPGTVLARNSLGSITSVSWQAQSQPGRFDIPPGTLDSVLIAFRNLTGIEVIVSDDKMRTLPSPGVSGVFTAEKALQQILAGTGINYKFSGPKIVTLAVPELAASVEVLGRISPASPKYTEPLRDTPQTISVIPKAVIEEQGATTLRDVLRNIPGLTFAAGEGGAPAGDNLTLRGFSARNDIFVDGVRDLGPQSRDPFNLEQVEVVKGPGSAFTGRGSAGGTINLVSKAPTVNRIFAGTLSFGSDATKRFTGDINLPIKNRTAFRLNLLAHDADVAGRSAVENQRWGVAPSVLFGLGTRTRLTLSYFYLQQDNLSDYGIPWVPANNNVLVDFRDKPAPVPRETFYGFRSRDFEKLCSDLATVKIERDISDAMTLRNQLRFGKSSRDSMATPPRFASPDSTVINREMRSWIAEDKIWDNQTDLRARFSTGKIAHSLVTGLSVTHENNIRQNRTAPNSPTTLLNPNPDDIYTGVITLSPFIGDITGKSFSLYAFDSVSLTKYFELNGGLRWDYFDVNGISTVPAPVERLDRMLSWRAGAVFKPVEVGSIYLAYGTSLSPSLEGLSYSTVNTALEPEKTYNLELGSKWDLINERLSLSGAIFRVEKTNARTPGVLPDDPPQVLQGRQRVDGIELGVSGAVTRAWRVFGAYTLLDGEIIRSNTPLEVGRVIQNTPRNSFSIWSTYEFPRRVEIGGGPRFVGRRFGNNTNTRFVDSYWTLDAMAAFPVSSHFDLRINLYNLNNIYYFDRLGGGHLIPGYGRSIMVSTGFRF
ncbi:MAG: TonB-dependent siderophore receptor [Acidobacteria bacterium]|nr:TonB-dependent siderophore receptor [Acidobacteriota bacterium]